MKKTDVDIINCGGIPSDLEEKARAIMKDEYEDIKTLYTLRDAIDVMYNVYVEIKCCDPYDYAFDYRYKGSAYGNHGYISRYMALYNGLLSVLYVIEEYLNKPTYYRKSWINHVKEFQNMTDAEKSEYCSHCGCTGGCNLCNDISKIKEEQILDDITYTDKELIKMYNL